MPFVGVPHRKQFVIGRSADLSRHQWPERFLKIALQSGWEIMHCPDLRLHVAPSGGGRENVLIGEIAEADPEKAPPWKVLRLIDRTNVAEMTKSWTGHWLLILPDGELFADCCGIFSVYMPRDKLLQKSGAFVVSNSPSLMIEFYKLPKDELPTKPLQPFAMPPWCFRPELRLLMAGEVLDLVSGKRSKTPYHPFQPMDVTTAEVRRRVATYLSTAIDRLQETRGETISCALSGGYDTRLNLSAALSKAKAVEAFTFVKPYFYITEADRLIPPKIASRMNVPHKMIHIGKFDRERARAYVEHAGGCVSTYPGNGYYHYAHGFWKEAGEGRIALDGQCYELAVNYHRTKFEPDFDATSVRAYGFGITDEDFSEVHDHWEHIRETAFPFDRRDLLFWTGNINGVYARMTQKHDLFADLFFPACNRDQFNLLLSVPIEERERCAFEATITAALAPQLEGIPYNPPEPFIKRLVKRLRNEVLKRI